MRYNNGSPLLATTGQAPSLTPVAFLALRLRGLFFA